VGLDNVCGKVDNISDIITCASNSRARLGVVDGRRFVFVSLEANDGELRKKEAR